MTINTQFIFPSGLPNGAPLVVTATTSGGAQVVHTATNEPGKADTLQLMVKNTTASAVRSHFAVGGVEVHGGGSIPPNGEALLTFALAGGLVLSVWGDTASALTVSVPWIGLRPAV